MSPLSMPGSYSADLNFGAPSPEPLHKGLLLPHTCSRSATALKALNVLPAPCPVLAMGMGKGAAPLLHLHKSNFHVREGNFRPGSGVGCVKLTLQRHGNMHKFLKN